MEKKIKIDELEKRTPFKVPDGYFEGLTSRVMASIPDTEENVAESKTSQKKKAKVVGLMPHKKKNGWIKWVVAAACVCGAVFFIANQQKEEDPAAGQLASTKNTPSKTVDANDNSQATATAETPSQKVYANGAYDLASHTRRNATPAPANITPTIATRTTTPTTISSVQLARTKTPTVNTTPVKQPTVEKKAQTVDASYTVSAYSSNDVAANNTPKAAANNDDFAMEYDMLDYTNMSSSEIYDYLAGNEYY